jgi:hypothetical protein
MVDLPDEVIEPAWRNLCAALLCHTAARVEEDTKLVHRFAATKPGGLNISAAVRWLGGGVGAVTLEEACDAVGYSPDRYRESVMRLAKSRKRVPSLISDAHS